MIKQALILTAAIAIPTLSMPAFAGNDDCEIEVAAASAPPAPFGEKRYVAFNAVNEAGLSRSVTLTAGQGPTAIKNIRCSQALITISATFYNANEDMSSSAENNQNIGQCQLKAGRVRLSEPGSSVSVVFPSDFTCDKAPA